MDISMNSIDNLTLTYFLNKTQYESILNKRNGVETDVAFSKDKQFYKKRILDLNKKLFRNEINDKLLISHFNNYVKSCITYLKMVDTTEVLQKQYEYMDANIESSSNSNPELADTYDIHVNNSNVVNNDISNNRPIKIVSFDISDCQYEISTCTSSDDSGLLNSIYETNNMTSNDYLLRNSNNMKKVNLDTFVVKTSVNNKPKILPKKQNVNIRTKAFKTKDIIAKKKNITNIYEDNK